MVRCLLASILNKESRPPSSVGLLRGSEGPERSDSLASTPWAKTQPRKCQDTVLTHFGPFPSVCSQAEEIQKHHYGVGKSWRSTLEIDMQMSTPSTPLCSQHSHGWDLSEDTNRKRGRDGKGLVVLQPESPL